MAILESDYSADTIGFGIEGVNNEFGGYDTRASLIAATYDYLFSMVAFDEPVGVLPQTASLNQNYLNLFNAKTVISFTIDVQTRILIDIYDIGGCRIITFLNQTLPVGIIR